MAQAFLIIISLLGAIYALFTKQGKQALGLLTMAIAFIFVIPGIASGIWEDIFGALTLVLYALGVIVIVYKKKPKEEIAKSEELNPKESEK